MSQIELKSVLVIDDSAYMRSLIRMALRKETKRYQIIGEAGDGKKAIELIYQLQPDIITLDNILPDMMGVEILEFIRYNGIDSKVIMISQLSAGMLYERAKVLGVEGYVAKPFESRDILSIMEKIIYHQ